MYFEQKPIKSWSVQDRPREKFLERGKDALTDAELLCILLSSGSSKHSAMALAKSLLSSFGGIKQLSLAGTKDLLKVSGIGPAKALSILSAFELARRKYIEEVKEVRMRTSMQAAKYLQPVLADLQQEVFYAIYLSQNHTVISEKLISKGSSTATLVDPKIVFQEAVSCMASSIIVAHNHPSGNLAPSQADINLTEKLREGALLFDIKLVDHLIISRKGFYSIIDGTYSKH